MVDDGEDGRLWRVLGNLESMVKDIRDGQPGRDAAMQRVSSRQDTLSEGQTKLSGQVTVVQATVDQMQPVLADMKERIVKLEAPAIKAAADRVLWRKRLAWTLTKITAGVLIVWALAEPIYRGIMERLTVAWLQRGGH